MLGKIHHAGYLVNDLDAVVAWYEKTFDGKQTSGGDGAGGNKVAFVRLGDGEVELIEPADKGELGGRSWAYHHIGYVVEDVEKAMVELKAKGFKFTTDAPIVNVAGYRLIHFDTSTTDGMRIHLTEASSLKH